MKKVIIDLLVLMIVLTACAPQSPSDPTTSVNEQPTHTSGGMTSAQVAALTALSERLNLPANEITLISTDVVTWPDGCMGIVRMGVMCTQAEVPGFKIVLKADGEEYEYHTNKDGSVVLLAEGAQSSSAAEDVVKQQLAQNLGLIESDISVVSDVVIEFGDSCMGIAMDDMMCAQVVTPGHIIVLEVDDIQYEYHTNEDGSRIQPATFALTWRRDGGIAGFCDRLTVFLSGEIYGNHCKTEDGRMNTFASLLSVREQNQFNSWIQKYGEVTLDASDPKGVSDQMTLAIELFGNGSGKPGKPVEDEIFTWAQELFQKLYNKINMTSKTLLVIFI